MEISPLELPGKLHGDIQASLTQTTFVYIREKLKKHGLSAERILTQVNIKPPKPNANAF
jgi:hypothetical protein